MAEELVRRGILVSAAHGTTMHPFGLAVLHRNFDLAHFLLSQVANPNQALNNELVFLMDHEGRVNSTIFGRIAWVKRAEDFAAFKYLVDKVSDRATPPEHRPSFIVDEVESVCIFHAVAMIENRSNPSDIATMTKAMMQALLSTEGYSDGEKINHRSHCGYTPLHIAAACSNDVAAAILLQMGAERNAVAKGLTPLDMWAAMPRSYYPKEKGNGEC